MKILITTEFYLPFRCGVTTAVLNERAALEAEGHEVRILTVAGDRKSYYQNGVYYIKNNFPQLYKDSYATVAFFDSLLKDIFEWQPDIVHSQCEFFTMVFAKRVAKKLQIPLVHTCHTDFEAYRVHFTSNEHLWGWATNTFIPKLLKLVDHIICPTEKVYNLLISYGVENPISILPTGLDLEMFYQALDIVERKNIRESFAFLDTDTVFVSVCRLSEEKNVSESITHFASIHKQRPNTKLLIVGDGTEKEKLSEMVEIMGLHNSVKFSGNIPMDKVWKYYKCGDIFISSSTSETQGFTYIEALASALPIVCKKDTVLNNTLIENRNGFSFLSDKEFLEKAIPLVDDADLRKEIGTNAKKSVEKYSLKHFAENLLDIFSKAEAEHRKKLSEKDE